MADKVPQSLHELKRQLEEQLQFLRSSAAAFDKGVEAESKRLALSIRILLHDTRNSKSLLGQLGRKSGKFLSTTFAYDPTSVVSHGGLVSIHMGLVTRYIANLDDNLFPGRWLEFDHWWTEPIFADKQKRILSRADLVLSMANQDGGAHVDPNLDSTYYALSRENSMGWMTGDGTFSSPMGDPAGAAVRQISHEVMRTLEPKYRLKKPQTGGPIVGGITVGREADRQPKPTAAKIGRNERCPCGNGRKYKHCHGLHA